MRDGKVVDASSTDPDVQGVRNFNAAVAAEPRVSATEIQTVGSKGYDGFALVLVPDRGGAHATGRLWRGLVPSSPGNWFVNLAG